LAVGALCALGIAASTAGASPGVTVVASGLDNPRGLVFTPNGNLYVAEAGHGGSECIPGAGEGGGPTCVGFTSGISQITASGVRRVVTGLVSAASPAGTAATGIDGLSAQGGRLFGIETESSDIVPAGPNPFLSPSTVSMARAQLGHLIEARPSGVWSSTADVGHTDFMWSGAHSDLVPGQFPDANPYAVLATPGVEWVIDAGSNTLDEVQANGSVTVVAFFPNPPSSDAVPTCIDRGPDGALYVGELTGGGNAPGASVVWRVVPGQAPAVWATGLTAVTGCGFGADGQFYAVEFSTLGLDNAAPFTGAVVRVAPHSTAPAVVAGGLSFPNGFAAGADGSLYFSNWSIMPASNHGGPTGEVDRIVP
jgi:hypothetical protein